MVNHEIETVLTLDEHISEQDSGGVPEDSVFVEGDWFAHFRNPILGLD